MNAPHPMVKFAPSGTYVMTKFTKETCHKLHEWAEQQGIPKPLDEDKIHCTIVQSSKTIENYHELNKEAMGIKVKVKRMALFATRFKSLSGEPEGGLVLILEAPELEHIHWELIDSGKANHFRPDYTPHTTISYFVPMATNLHTIGLPHFELEVDRLIAEPIDIDWMNH